MKLSRKAIVIFTTLALMFLSGCVNLVQEVTVNQDGSGSLRFAVGVETTAYPQFQAALPEVFEFENLFTDLIVDERVTDVQQTHYETGNRTWDAIEMQVEDMAGLFAEDRRFGPLTMTIDPEDGEYFFEQTLDMERSNVNIPGINLLDLSSAGYNVRLITPHILSTNGLQEEAGVSLWEVPLGDFIQGGESIYLWADYSLEPYEGRFIPWETFFPYVVYGFLAIGFISILVVIIVNTSGEGEGSNKIEF
ncbi:MAG: hypothetical protein ACOCYU_07010 [Brevefilum sp.]